MDLVEAIYIAATHHQAGRLAEAEAIYRQVLAHDPNHADALNRLGVIAKQCGHDDAAIDLISRAIRLRPDQIDPHINLGTIFKQRGQLDEAIASYRRAIELDPNCAEAHFNLGVAQKDVGDVEAAIASYDRALALKPHWIEADTNRVYTLLFHPLATARTHLEAAHKWSRNHAIAAALDVFPHKNDPSSDRRLRIGYVAPNFREHCQSLFTVPLLSNHDHAAFEVFCYSDVIAADAVTERLRGYADVWRATSTMSDAQLAHLIREDRIDVLVDLTLHMANHRLLVFARKPAPVQVTWLGYPGTTGVSAIEYRLSDPYLDPPGEHDEFYTERTIRLPETFWCYDPLTSEPDSGELSALGNGWITFGCLNNFCKVTDRTLRLWAGVLRLVENSRLLLLTPSDGARDRVRAILGHEGIDGARIEFVSQMPRPLYLRNYQRIDIALDTFPVNGHTTSLDALWMGVPVVTLVGELALGRAGLSQLSNLGLPELTAMTEDQFISIAAALAGAVDRLRHLRATLRQRLMASPIADAPRFARNIEAVYRQIWRKWAEAQ